MPNTLTSASMFENEVVDFFNQTFYSCSLALDGLDTLPTRVGGTGSPARQLRRFLWQLRNSPALSLPVVVPDTEASPARRCLL